jgi:hypothetical protein
MCDTCVTASQHFTSGTQPLQRQLQTSVDQGTSPDWHSAAADEHDYRG